MPEKATRARAASSRRRGNASSTQAGEYVREEMHHKRSGKHPVKNRKQAIAIGLSKARKEGVKVPKKAAKRRSSAKKSSSRSTRRSSSSRKSPSSRGGGSRRTSASRSRSRSRTRSRASR